MTLATRILIVKALYEFFGAAFAALKGEANNLLEPGTRLPAITPGRVKLGYITKTEPTTDAKVTSPSLFSAWVKENYPEAMSSKPGKDEAAITKVLAQHAPELLISEPSAEFVKDMRKRALDTGVVTGPGAEADVPGFALVKGTSTIQTRATDNAFAEVLAMLRGGLSLDSLLPKQIEGEQS